MGMMTALDLIKISSFSAAAESSKPSGTTTLQKFLDGIKNGAWKDTVERYRKLSGDTQKSYKRTAIPAVTVAGVWTKRHADDGKVTPSGFVCMDFDDVENPAALIRRCGMAPYVVTAFTSVSGKGVAAIVKCDGIAPENARETYDAIAKDLGSIVQHAPDTSGSDLMTRLRFVSYDPDLRINENARTFTIVKAAPSAIPTPAPAPERVIIQKPPAGIDDTPAAEHLRKIIRRGQREKETGHGIARHSFMNSAVVTGWRYILGGYLTPAAALDAIMSEYLPLFDAGEQSTRREDVLRSMFAPLSTRGGAPDVDLTSVNVPRAAKLADIRNRQQGPLIPDAGDRAHAPDDAKDARHVSDEETALALSGSFRPTWNNQPREVPPVLTLCRETELGYVGGLTVIIAEPKAGKSTVCSAIWAAYYAGEAGKGDTFGFTVKAFDGQPRALYFDTEQQPSESWEAWRRTLRRMECAQGDDLSPDSRETWICLSSIESNIKRQAALFQIIENDPLVGLVILDGIADFVKDVNDGPECQTFLRRLSIYAGEAGVSVVVTIHENKGRSDVNPRGHLGSDILRKAAGVIKLSKNRLTGVHTIAAHMARRGPDHVKFTFEYDQAKGTHVSIGPAQERFEKVTELHVKFRERVTGRKLIARKEIAEILTQLDADFAKGSEDAQKRALTRETKALVNVGILSKHENRGWYTVVSAEDPDDAENLLF